MSEVSEAGCEGVGHCVMASTYVDPITVLLLSSFVQNVCLLTCHIV